MPLFRLLLTLVGICFVGTAAIWIVTEPQVPAHGWQPPTGGNGDPEHGRLAFAAGDCASCYATPHDLVLLFRIRPANRVCGLIAPKMLLDEWRSAQ